MKETELDLRKLVGILWKKAGYLLLAAVVGTALSLGASRFLITPKYQSTVVLYVNETKSAKDLADSFDVIVKMRESLMEVILHTELSCSHNELRKQITVSSVNETDFFEVTVTAADPYEADRIADAIGQILPEQVAQIMEGTSVKVVGEAIPAAQPSSPNYPNNAILGFGLGLMTAAGWFLLEELFLKRGRI